VPSTIWHSVNAIARLTKAVPALSALLMQCC
jgi:hypothetical protein